MANYFPHLNAPLVLNNAILKNRLFFPNALPKTQQGPESFPADPIISFYSNIAKNGSAVICYADMASEGQRTAFNSDEQHFPMYNLADPSVENYISQVADCVHYYGSKIVVDVSAGNQMDQVDVVDGAADDLPPKELDHEVHIAEMKPQRRAMTPEDMAAHIQIAVKKAKFYQRMGFDGGYLGFFQGKFGNFLSVEKNARTDDYGGSVENRERFPMLALKTLREAVGPDFMLILDVNRFSKGLEWEDALHFIAQAEPYIDMIHLRPIQVQTAFEGTEDSYANPQNIQYAKDIRAKGIQVPIAVWTGFQELSRMDQSLADGVVDMISAGRFQLCNPTLAECLKTGKEDSLFPCLLCNKCHGDTLTGPWVARCTLNPEIGLAARLNRMVSTPERKKKVAVIGGGPAGMAATIYLRRRGHDVVLYEKENRLGGQILTAEYPVFKWPLKRFLTKFTEQVMHCGADVRLGVEATPEALSAESFDAMIVAVGACPVKPGIPGADDPAIYMPIDVYGHEQELGKEVVCIGGSETSVETALYLAQSGHKVTLLTRKKRIASDANPIHYVDSLRRTCQEERNLTIHVLAETTEITPHSVTFRDEDGMHSISCDSVVAAGGMKALRKEAAAYAPIVPEIYYAGDCVKVQNVAHALRTAYAAASQI